MNDPIVEAVRQIRDEHAQKFGYNLTAICADIRQHQASCGHHVVRLTPRKTESAKEKISIQSS